MFKRTLLVAAAISAIATAPAYGQATIVAAPGSNPYAGPAPTYDFETPAPVTGGLVTTGDLSGIRAQPFGSTGNYWTVGPSDGSPGTLDLHSFASLATISFIWGSVDQYNTIELLNRVGSVLATFTGSQVGPADGNQTLPANNPLVSILIDAPYQADIGGLRLTSTQNAFETDNYSFLSLTQTGGGVPEPAIWAMLLIGFGFIGAFMRGEKRQQRMRLKYV